MGLAREKGIYVFEDLLGFGVIAGFTDKSFPGLDVEEDISHISSFLGFTYQDFIYLNQVHGNTVICPDQGKKVFRGDGLVTGKKKTALIVRTADCLPVFFYDTQNKAVGLIHLGWRPAKDGILSNFLEKAQDLSGVDKRDSLIGIGPGLRKCCYEVGGEFLGYPAFLGFVERKNSGYFLDIVRFLEKNLTARGLRPENFLDCGICSMCSPEVYSYRRDKTDKRTVSFIIQK